MKRDDHYFDERTETGIAQGIKVHHIQKCPGSEKAEIVDMSGKGRQVEKEVKLGLSITFVY